MPFVWRRDRFRLMCCLSICTCQKVSFKIRAGLTYLVDGQEAARIIKSTSHANTNTPIIAVTSYEAAVGSGQKTLFAALLAKPVSKDSVLGALKKLHFTVIPAPQPDQNTQAFRSRSGTTVTLPRDPFNR